MVDEGGVEIGDGTFKSPRVRARGQEEDGGEGFDDRTFKPLRVKVGRNGSIMPISSNLPPR